MFVSFKIFSQNFRHFHLIIIYIIVLIFRVGGCCYPWVRWIGWWYGLGGEGQGGEGAINKIICLHSKTVFLNYDIFIMHGVLKNIFSDGVFNNVSYMMAFFTMSFSENYPYLYPIWTYYLSDDKSLLLSCIKLNEKNNIIQLLLL